MTKPSTAERDTELPIQEKVQTDPISRIAHARVGAGGTALLGVIIVLVIWVVLYGLNSPGNKNEGSAPPVPAETTASSNSGPGTAAGGNTGVPAQNGQDTHG